MQGAFLPSANRRRVCAKGVFNMTKSELINVLGQKLRHLSRMEVEVIVDTVFNGIKQSLVRLHRVELRGFGIFEVRKRRARKGRNPKSGELVQVRTRYVPFFKVGKEMRQRLQEGQEGLTETRRSQLGVSLHKLAVGA